MKRIIVSVIVIASLCLCLLGNVTATNKINYSKVESTLQENCKELKTDIGTAEIKYKVIKKSDCYEVQAHLDYALFNDIQFGEHNYFEKLKATEQIKEFTESICKAVTTLYPDEKWQGFYSATFESILGRTKSIMYFNWCNFKDDNILNRIAWRTEKDSSWDLAKCEWLEK